MATLAHDELERLAAFLQEGSDVSSLEEFSSYILKGLPGIVRCNAVGYNEVDLESRRVVVAIEPEWIGRSTSASVFGSLIDQHPLINYCSLTGDGRAFKISDFLSEDEFHALELYQAVYRPIGAEDQMAFTLPAPPSLVIGIALNREARDFTERDRQLLNLARPYLSLLYRRFETDSRLTASLVALQRAVEVSDQASVILGPTDRIKFATTRARRLLSAYYRADDSARLPVELVDWLALQRRGLVGNFESAPPAETLILLRDDARLIIQYLPPIGPRDCEVLLLEEKRVTLSAASLAALNLTAREAEILAVLANGHTNIEIGRALGISEKTVRTHLERIYAKLGVGNRAGALAAAFNAAYGAGASR